MWERVGAFLARVEPGLASAMSSRSAEMLARVRPSPTMSAISIRSSASLFTGVTRAGVSAHHAQRLAPLVGQRVDRPLAGLAGLAARIEVAELASCLGST